MQTQVRALLKEQYDQGLHCLTCHRNLLHTSLGSRVELLEFKDMYSKELRYIKMSLLIEALLSKFASDIHPHIHTLTQNENCTLYFFE